MNGATQQFPGIGAEKSRAGARHDQAPESPDQHFIEKAVDVKGRQEVSQ